jgi:hypothetical protein
MLTKRFVMVLLATTVGLAGSLAASSAAAAKPLRAEVTPTVSGR